MRGRLHSLVVFSDFSGIHMENPWNSFVTASFLNDVVSKFRNSFPIVGIFKAAIFDSARLVLT